MQVARDQPIQRIMVTSGTIFGDVESGLSAVCFGALTVTVKGARPGDSGFQTAAEWLTEMVEALGSGLWSRCLSIRWRRRWARRT